ncbi:MAG TPA: DUF1987 domain-containing protein [Bacteroidales bacterium]|nr:DUF1987 domain-containing protein [Bacteroidales bacterium]
MQIKPYIAEPSRRTPGIVLGEGRILIMGRSIPDNPREFYLPVVDWITEYVKISDGKTRVDLGFDFINTSSTKFIFLLLKQLSETQDVSSKVSVTWYFEEDDDDMAELGYILRSLIECPFKIEGTMIIDQSFYETILAAFE